MANKQFEYNVHQCVDFTNPDMYDSDDADTFFDVESDNSPTTTEDKENNHEIKEVPERNDGTLSTEEKQLEVAGSKREIKKGMRRLSADKTVISSGLPFSSNQELLFKTLGRLSTNGKRQSYSEGMLSSISEEKTHPMTTRKDSAVKKLQLDLQSCTIGGKGDNRKRKLSPKSKLTNNKYIGLAENVMHFQNDTPPRFHSSRRSSLADSRRDLLKARTSFKLKKTVPKTPKLLTASRSRPSTITSTEEREIIEFEELQKQQVKAVPLNKKILQPPKQLQKSEKHSTIPEPFDLTEVFKKPAPKVNEEPFVFSARPVPRVLLEKTLGLPPKNELPITVPQSPNITKSRRSYKPPVRVPALSNKNKVVLEEVYAFGLPANRVVQLKKTELKPFSFTEKDKERLERKEKKKQEILEAEKKAREFKANPLPSYLLKDNSFRRNSQMDTSCVSTTSSVCDEIRPTFKARSPRVLRKNPFKPILEHSHSEPIDVTLYTERRFHERREFETRQKLNEEIMAYEREQVEMEKKRKIEEEIAKAREESVHKARPMPKFKTPPKFSNVLPLTNPKSPKFTNRKRTSKSD